MESNDILLVDGTALLGGLAQALPTTLSFTSVDATTGIADNQALVNNDQPDPFANEQPLPEDEEAVEENRAEVPFSVEDIKLNESFFSLYDEDWISQGKFGDFDGLNDAQLSIEDTEGEVVETFSLIGNGYGEVFKDDEYQYLFFSGIDETTEVEVSALSNIRFDDYIGSSLQVQTEGSITAGDIVLLNPDSFDSPGLILQSGLGNVQSSTSGRSYSITNLGTLPGSKDSAAFDINDSGQIVGRSYDTLDGGYDERGFLYSNGQIMDLGTLSGMKHISVTAINNSGQVVGEAYGALNRKEDIGSPAILYSNGQITNLGIYSGGTSSYAFDINDSGQTVGSSNSWDVFDESNDERAVLYNNGQMRDLGLLPGATSSTATGINNSGQIVGDSGGRAFLYSGCQMRNLGTLYGMPYSAATAINNLGQVIGHSFGTMKVGGYGHHFFLYSDGQLTDLGISGGGYTHLNDINDFGQIVGESIDKAFLYSNGQMLNLNDLVRKDSGWILNSALAINDRGQIVGAGLYEGQGRAFLLDPITFTATPGITVGNIATLGDSILLESSEITLAGPSITTTGGSITVNGPTIIDTSTGKLTINSTDPAEEESSGDITFTDTLDAQSAGTHRLKVKAGTGNLSFEGAVGGEAALSEFIIASANTLSAQDISTESDITFNVIDDLSTNNLTTNSLGKVEISLGKIEDELYDSTGDVSLGEVSATELGILSNGAVTMQGTVETEEGDIDITALEDISFNRDDGSRGRD